jgi:VWFA-related protein
MTLGQIVCLGMVCGLLPSHGVAQQRSRPSAPPATQDRTAAPPVTTLKVAVRRVVLDVTVTDANGKPVRGLKPEDFSISEDKSPQPIRSFEVHTLAAPASIAKINLPTNTFANMVTGPTGGPTTVILYDLLNTPQDAQAYAHEQLLSFLRKRKAGGQVAIFVLTDRLHMLQGFTEDDNQLIAALSRQQGKGYKSGMLQQQGEATASSGQLSSTEGNQNGADAQPDLAFQQVATMLKHMEATESSYLTDQRVDLTLDALQEIARFLIGLPGRKNLLWLSGSFPAGILPDGDLGSRDSVNITRNYTKAMVAATDLLTVSHVAVYPIDVRGLQTNPMFSAGSNQVFEPGQAKDGKAVRNFSRDLASEHTTMDSIAATTGGRAFYNTNGLAEAEASAVEEGSLYYTLSYAPTNLTYDGKLRKVKVQTTQPGYRLSYRRTYFADNLDNVARDAMDNPDDVLAVALQHGAPVAHQLFFEAHVQTEGAPVAATPGQMQELVKYEAMATRNKRKALAELNSTVMLQRYVIQYILLPRQLDVIEAADGSRHDNLEFAAISYNDDGLTLNGLRTRLQDVIQPERWAEMQQSGYHVPMAILIPVQARSLRLAVRDMSSSHMGSIELPLPLAKEDPLPVVAPVAKPSTAPGN